MFERSSQSLWKIITGHSAIQDTELILVEVKSNKSQLTEGLLYFKSPSSVSETKLKSSKDIKGKKLEFVLEISQRLYLDQIQCLQLFQNFLLESYRGSFDDINTRLSNQLERQALLVCIEEYYHKERLYLLRCIKQFLGYWQDVNHPYRELYSNCLEVLHFDGSTFIPEIWKQFEITTTTELPATIESPEEEKKWLQQLLLEQCELLEILLLFYKDYELPVISIIEKIKLFQKIGFGYQPRGQYTIEVSYNVLSQHISHLCSLIILESFDLDWLQQNQERKERLQHHHMLNPDITAHYKTLEGIIEHLDSTPCHTPLLLSWSLFCYMTTDDDNTNINHVRLLGDRALKGKVFVFLLSMLESSFFSGDRPVAGVCKNVLYTLLALVVSLFSEESLGDPKVLLKISAQLLTHPRLRLVLWENGLESDLGLLLTSALKKLPLDIDVIEMLCSLSHDEVSAHNIHTLLSEVTWYTEDLAPHELAGKLDVGPQEGTWVLTQPRVLFEREYLTLGLSPLMLSTDTVGLITAPNEDELGVANGERQVVCWKVPYSIWNLFAAKMIQLVNTPGIGIDPTPHPLINFVVMATKLATEVLKFDWSVSTDLQPMTSQLFTILQKFSGLPHPPAILIATCLECMAVMAERQPLEVWSQLGRTGYLPQVMGNIDQTLSLQVSPGHYGHLLNVWERAHGIYPITTGMLHLLHSTLKSHDSHVISESVVATVVYIMQAVFITSQNWRYGSQKERDEFCRLLLKLCHLVLEIGPVEDKGNLQNVLHSYIVELLLNSSGHVLLINVLGTGVNTIDRLTASAINWFQTSVVVESLKLCFKITDLLIQNKTNDSVTPLEQTLATRTLHYSSLSSPQHLITALAMYIHHHDDPAVPVDAIKLLARLATVAPMSMFSCLGDEAVTIRDSFVNRLSARTEDTNLKIAILNLITVSVGTQPGLLELLLSLKPTSQKPSSQSTGAGQTSQASQTSGAKEEREKGLYQVDHNSCLQAVLDMIDPAQQVPPTPPSLLSAGMRLLKVLWQGRHVAALDALRYTDNKFWEHLMKPLFEDIPQSLQEEDQENFSYKLQSCSYIFHIVAMELYYVIEARMDKELKTVIKDFVNDNNDKKWCKIYQLLVKHSTSGREESMIIDGWREGVVSSRLIKAQFQLAESWKTFLLVAINYHDSLFEFHTETRKKVILQEMLTSLEVQVHRLPNSAQVISEILTLYMSLLKKWTSVKIPSNLIGRFCEILAVIKQYEDQVNIWQLLPMVYSCLTFIVTSIRKAEGDVQPRFTQGLLPIVGLTLEHYTHYQQLDLKYNAETYAIHLLSELTATLPEDDPLWLTSLREHSILLIVTRACIGHMESLSHPDFVTAILLFFITLANCEKGAEVLVVNNVFQILNISLCVVVNKLNPHSQDGQVGVGQGGVSYKELLPPPKWLKVWLTSLKLVTCLLRTLGHYVVGHVVDFVAAHCDHLLLVLDVYITTRHLDAVNETQYVCQLLQQLVHYNQQWRVTLVQHHHMTIERLLTLFNGVIAVMSRERTKELIKTMDSHGLLLPEHSSTAIKAKTTRERRPSGGQFPPGDNDEWIKHSPAYLQLREGLVSIATSCLVILNRYTPPLNELYMSSYTQPLDLSEWPPLFQLSAGIPVIDPTSPPSISTLTSTLTVGLELLKRLDPHRSSISGTPSRSPSKSSPLKSPITPGIPRVHTAAGHQKRTEIFFMLEQAVVLLMSQSLRYLLDDNVDIYEKQVLKKQLVSELGNFCQVLLINFHRKGAPSPRSAHRTSSISLSSSRQTLLESSSGRASSHSFSDVPEQGLFKLADLFARSKTLTR